MLLMGVHEFISPLSNDRSDQYGGSTINQQRLLHQVLEAVRSEWPLEKPLSLRISAEDYLKEGIHPQEGHIIKGSRSMYCP